MFSVQRCRSKVVIIFSLALLLSLVTIDYSFSALVGYWSFDQGDSVKDLSSNKNHGQLKGNPKLVKGQSGDALEFNGSSDWVSIGHNGSIANFDQLSISAWIKLIKVNGWTTVIEKGVHENWSYGFFLEADSTLSFYVSQKGNKLACCIGDFEIKPNGWYHIAGTYDGKLAKLWVNGKAEAELAASGPLHPTDGLPLAIGCRGKGDGESFFNGIIDEVTLWNSVVSIDEMKQPLKTTSVIPLHKLSLTWANIKSQPK